ncbi:MAG: PEP-CTERM sorting domain-containing protein, partial [Tepidisphaeraceae bacterium]
TTLSTYTGGISIGGDITFAGPVNWSLGAGAVTLSASHTITANTAGSSGTTIAGAVTGAGGITLAPASTGAITVTNSGDAYTGSTTISGGTLFDNGDITASPVTVASPGVLAGNGTLGGPVADGGLIAPGATSGTIANLSFVSGLSFNGSLAAYDADVNAAGQSDDLAVAGNLDLGTGTTLNVNVLDSTSGGIYTIATYTGSLTGTFAATNLPAGYSVDYGTGNDSAITLVIPEPTSLSLLAIAAAALIRRRRR